MDRIEKARENILKHINGMSMDCNPADVFSMLLRYEKEITEYYSAVKEVNDRQFN